MNPIFDPQPVQLEGTHVRLEPLTLQHAPDLLEAAQDALLWRYLPIAAPTALAEIQSLISTALELQATGAQVPFAVVLRANHKAIGSTRYLAISRPDRGLEIGWTWLDSQQQRTAVNTECKYLLLRHAFEALGAIRVQLKTDKRNEKSQRAIERIGGVREGVLRQHIILWDGFVRDTVFYSIINTEWPQVKAELERKLQPAAQD